MCRSFLFLGFLLCGLFSFSMAWAAPAKPLKKIVIFRTAAPFGVEMEKGLRDGLAKLGYREGRNLQIMPTVVVKSRIEDFSDTANMVQNALLEQPDVVVTIGTQPSVPAWKVLESTRTPLVFSGVSFPVEGGLIQAYGQPTGKNVTGIGYAVSPRKRMELMRQLFPDTSRFRKIAFAYSGQVLQDATYVKYLKAAGTVGDWKVSYINYFDYAQNNASLRMLIDKLQEAQPDLVFGWYDLDFLGNDATAFKELLDKSHKPLVGLTSKAIQEGAVAGVLTDHQWLGEQQARMIDQVLRGVPAGSIPPLEPTSYIFELNMRKARELGVKFSPAILESARIVNP